MGAVENCGICDGSGVVRDKRCGHELICPNCEGSGQLHIENPYDEKECKDVHEQATDKSKYPYYEPVEYPSIKPKYGSGV